MKFVLLQLQKRAKQVLFYAFVLSGEKLSSSKD